MTDVASRLEIIEARFAISELRSQYCWYTTRGLRDDVVDLFTDDCLFQNSRNAHDEPLAVTGKAALHEYLAKMKPGRRVPMVMNEVIKVKGDAAEGTCVMQSIGEDSFCGHYIDEFRRVDGRWLFSVRRFYPYWPIFKPDTDRRDP